MRVNPQEEPPERRREGRQAGRQAGGRGRKKAEPGWGRGYRQGWWEKEGWGLWLGREGFGTEEPAVLPAATQPGRVTRVGFIPTRGGLVHILLHTSLHRTPTDRSAGLGVGACHAVASTQAQGDGKRSQHKASGGPAPRHPPPGSLWLMLWTEGSEHPQVRWVVSRMRARKAWG